MRFTPSFIEDLKYRNQIDQTISSYVLLKRAGSNLSGLCPFHNEKSPSFFVFPNTSSYHCFGCGVGGDVITFIMNIENLDYPSAVQYLCKKSGIEFPADENDNSNEIINRSRLYELNKEAAKFFVKSLDDPKNKVAKEYIEKRKIPQSIVRRFGLGYAPNSYTELHDYLYNLGYKDEELKAAFLCGKSEKTGNYFDMFRNRLMFPIIDNFGNVIAFGGRALSDEIKPKYVNTSDTVVFKKSRNLFSLNFARSCSSDYIILCEGYMDVIANNIAGISNAVATLGTALTPEQARIIAKYTKKVILSYDSDEPGIAAAKRAIPILTECGLEVSVLQIPNAKDPDEYVKKFGKENYKKLIESSTSKLEFLLKSITGKYNLTNPDEKISASKELCQFAASIDSNIERQIYIRKISEILQVDEKSINSDVEKALKKKSYSDKSKQNTKIIETSLGYGDRINKDYAKNVKIARLEESILGILLIYPEFIKNIKSGEINLSADDFFTEFNKKVFTSLIDCEEDIKGTEFLNETFSPEEMSRIIKMKLQRAELDHNDLDVLKENVNLLKSSNKQETNSNEDKDNLDSILNLINNKK